MDAHICEYIAQGIAAHLRRDVTGNINRPTAWRRLARKLGVSVEEYSAPGKSPGHCMPALVDEEGAVGGTIFINTYYSKTTRVAVYIHELAHLYLYAMTPPFTVAVAQFYDDNPEEEAHSIARRVERIILGE